MLLTHLLEAITFSYYFKPSGILWFESQDNSLMSRKHFYILSSRSISLSLSPKKCSIETTSCITVGWEDNRARCYLSLDMTHYDSTLEHTRLLKLLKVLIFLWSSSIKVAINSQSSYFPVEDLLVFMQYLRHKGTMCGNRFIQSSVLNQYTNANKM
jgi:hypothetical protein